MLCTLILAALPLFPDEPTAEPPTKEAMQRMEKARAAARFRSSGEPLDHGRYRDLVAKSNAFAKEVAGDDDARYHIVAQAALAAALRAALGRTEEAEDGLAPVPVESPGTAARALPRRATAAPGFETDPEYLANSRALLEEASKQGSDLFPLAPPSARIFGVGSRRARDDEFPDCVAVGSFDGDRPSFCCTGTLVGPNLVVTAGHCKDCAVDAAVFVGSDISRPGKVYRGRVVQHPQYATELHNDLSVIVLTENVVDVAPRRIAPPDVIIKARFVRAVGFGTTDASGRRGFGIKRLADVPIASTGCTGSRDASRYDCDRGLELIAIGPESDSCRGDSGGPIYVRERKPDGSWGDWMVAGATSRAIRNAARVCGDGGVYVRLDKYLPFIQGQVSDTGGPPPGEDDFFNVPPGVRAANNVRGTITAPDNRKYRILRSPERSVETEEEPFDDAALRSTSSVAPEDRYLGKDRKKAKLTVATGTIHPMTSVKKLIAGLPRDEVMEELEIPKTADSGRVAKENHNYRVKAFLFAASAEKDQDYHLIIGDKGAGPKYMTVEISALAADGSSPAAVVKARRAFKEFFKDHLPGEGSYDFYDPPIPVEFAGSLFWDATHEHGPNKPGPSQRKPATIFELHPVTEFKYLTNN